MKETLDKTEIARFHKMLRGDEENDIPKKSIESCSKILGCELSALKGLTPKAFKDFEASQKALIEGTSEDTTSESK